MNRHLQLLVAVRFTDGWIEQREICSGSRLSELGLPQLEVAQAELTVSRALRGSGEVVERIAIDGQAWRMLVEGASTIDMLQDLGSGLEAALRAQLDRVINQYEHDACDAQWEDEHSCACNDRCPCCRAEIEPSSSRWLRSLSPGPGTRILVLDGATSEDLEPQGVSEASERPRLA